MHYFSGFSLSGESEIFGEFLDPVRENPYVVAGFSYGAQKALEYVYTTSERIDRLMLLSPAWFLDKKSSFVTLQLRAFEKEPEKYLCNFLEAASHPTGFDLSPYVNPGSLEELEALLTYAWPAERLESVSKRGVRIEVYLGGKDRIVNASKAHDFFKKYAESWFFKPYGHLLRHSESTTKR